MSNNKAILIAEVTLLEVLRRAHDGEDPDMLVMELYLQSVQQDRSAE